MACVADFWYTAWVNAGMPEMDDQGEFLPSAAWLAEQDSLNRKFNAREGSLIGHDD
jgi:hypothetical protein